MWIWHKDYSTTKNKPVRWYYVHIHKIKEFNINEVFKFSDNAIFYDTEGNEYKIYEDAETGTKYIFNEIISDELLKKTFVLTK